jgi:hypothetical protein
MTLFDQGKFQLDDRVKKFARFQGTDETTYDLAPARTSRFGSVVSTSDALRACDRVRQQTVRTRHNSARHDTVFEHGNPAHHGLELISRTDILALVDRASRSAAGMKHSTRTGRSLEEMVSCKWKCQSGSKRSKAKWD